MKKIVRFGLLLTQDEKAALTKLAESEGGLSEAAILRRLIRKSARESGLWVPELTATRANHRGEQNASAKQSPS